MLTAQRFAIPLLIGAFIFLAAEIAGMVLHIDALIAVPVLILAVAALIAAMVGLAVAWRDVGVANREIALRVAAAVVLAALVILVVAYVASAKAMMGAVSPALHHASVHVLPSTLFVALAAILGCALAALAFAMRREVVHEAVRIEKAVEPVAVDVETTVAHAVAVAVADVRRPFAAREAMLRDALAAALARAHRHEATPQAPAVSAPLALKDFGARPAPLSRQLGGSQSPHEELHMIPSYTALTGPLADFLVTELDANQALILAEIQKGETSVETLIATELKNIPRPSGMLGLVEPLVVTALEKYATQLVSQYGPSVVFTFIDAAAHRFATQLGG